MKILDLSSDELFLLYQDYIHENATESIKDNAFCIIENEDNVLAGADYLYNDFLLWLKQKENFLDDEVSMFITLHGDYIYNNIVSELTN